MVRCPCGQWVTIGTAEDGATAVLHPMPPCDQYVALNPVDYLHYLNTCKRERRHIRPARRSSN